VSAGTPALAISNRAPTLSDLPLPPAGRTGWPWTEETAGVPETAPDGRPWPKISIVTPSFNQGHFIEEALRSVLLQGYPRLELIVIDGGSRDGTIDIIRKYEPWLSRWTSEPDSGPADALNKGFRGVRGDILGFLNADDFYLPGALLTVGREFRMYPSVEVVSGNGYLAGASSDLGPRVFSDRWHPARFAYGACILVQQSTFFRRRAFEAARGFNQETRTCWDLELWANMARAGARFHTLEEFLAVFRLHADSITGSPQLVRRRLRDTRMILQRMRGRRESARDRLLEFVHRTMKFCGHPRRTVTQRLFVHSTLGRWSL
jgi:glycosyltransferase involved in cell wall biosynthesis